MKRVLKNIRSVRLGLRFQLSLLLFVPILLISLLLSLAIFKQNEANILNEIIRFSGAILRGGYSPAIKYLTNDRIIRNSRRSGVEGYGLEQHRIRRNQGLDELVTFFPSIVSKERLLDQAFLININENSATENIEDEADTRFIYFIRNRAGVKEYTKSDKVLKSLYDTFTSSVNIDSRLVYASVPPEMEEDADGKNAGSAEANGNEKNEKQKFVVVGIPVFNDKQAEELYTRYSEYLENLHNSKTGKKRDDSFNSEKAEFETAFLSRLVHNYTEINYFIRVQNDQGMNDLYAYLTYYHFDIRRLTSSQREFLKEEFLALVSQKKDKFSVNDYLEAADLLQRKYNLAKNNNITWVRLHFFEYLKRKNISLSPVLPFDKLALCAYRSDLDGIIGVYLLRSEFYSNQIANRREIFNMALALFIRCIILALFLPGILIRKINLVAEGAYEIGRGNFDHRITIRGADEMGRLADIFNVMGKNLKRAREEIIDKHRMEAELKTASEIQSVLLPDKLPEIASLEFAAHYEAQSEAGGDYYDVIPLDENRFAVTVADVSGHGVGAGLVMTMTRTLVHCFASSETVRELVKKLNDHLYRNTESRYFVTMFYGIYDASVHRMSFANAGHTPPVLVRNNKATLISLPGVALGAVPDSMYANFIQTKSLQLESGDTFVLYTDGVIEAMNANNEEYGEERFTALLEKNSRKSAGEIKSALISDLKKHTGRVLQSDDITILILKVF